MAIAESGDPVVAIAEADATGETADLYADIRACLGAPIVNLIWRHLATIPGALPWAWNGLRPAYVSGAVVEMAAGLLASMPPGQIKPFSLAELCAGGLADADLRSIRNVIRSYDRTNAMNLIALLALRMRVKPDPAASETAAINDSLPTTGVGMLAPVTDPLPPLLNLRDMDTRTAALVNQLHHLGRADPIMPSMYRQLAHWPVFLDLVYQRLAPIDDAGSLEPLVHDVTNRARQLALRFSDHLADPAHPLPPGIEPQLNIALSTFIEGPLSKMTCIAALIDGAWPEQSNPA